MRFAFKPAPAWLLCCATASIAAGPASAGDEIFRSGFENAVVFPDSANAGADVVVKSWHGAGADRTVMIYAGGGDGSSATPVRYGECVATCSDTANWQFVTLGSYGAAGLGGGARIALDGNGHPRAVWYSQASIGGNGTLYYGECTGANCASLAAWTIEPLLSFSGGDSMALLARGAFALDPGGQPRLLLQDLGSGTYYGQCDTGCTQYANWSFNQFSTISAQADLEFSPDGVAHVAFESPAPNIIDGEDMFYAACASNCGVEANWPGVMLITVNDNLVNEPFSLALDSHGAPHIGFYDDKSGAHELAYAWCSTNCATAGANDWQAFSTGLPLYSGYKGVAIAIDGTDIPHLAYGGSPDGISDTTVDAAVCIQNCSSAPVWQWHDIAATSDIPGPPPDPCGTGLSQWQIGTSPGLAIAAGISHVGFGTYAYFSCITGHDPQGNPIYTVETYNGPVGYGEP